MIHNDFIVVIISGKTIANFRPATEQLVRPDSKIDLKYAKSMSTVARRRVVTSGIAPGESLWSGAITGRFWPAFCFALGKA